MWGRLHAQNEHANMGILYVCIHIVHVHKQILRGVRSRDQAGGRREQHQISAYMMFGCAIMATKLGRDMTRDMYTY